MKYFSSLSLKIVLVSFFFVVLVQTSFAQGRPISHADYNDWKSIEKTQISNNGSWVSYEVNPQEGDGVINLFNKSHKSTISFTRGASAQFSANSNFILFKIVPQFDTVRQLKLKKTKKDKLPKDSLGIYLFDKKEVKKYPDLLSFKLPGKESDVIAFTIKNRKLKDLENDTAVADTATKENVKPEKKKKSKKDKHKTNTLVVMNPISGDSVSFTNVSKYTISDNGNAVAFIQKIGDSIDSVMVNYYSTSKKVLKTVFAMPGYSENIILDKKGKQLAFTYSSDTIKEKAYSLYYLDINKSDPKIVSGNDFSNLTDGWSVSQHGNIYFNDKGSELYFGTSPKPIHVPKDTLTKDEKVSVDIWNWKDLQLQPQQLKQLNSEKKRSYVAVYFLDKDRMEQLASPDLKSVRINKKTEKPLSLGFNHTPYQRMTSWEASRYNDVYLVNRESGDRNCILKKVASSVYLSPNQNYVLWYNIADSSWNSYNIKTSAKANITNKCKANFYNELNDIPNEAYPYGIAGWTEKGEVVIYDRFDLWKFDLSGKHKPENITAAKGRKNNIRFRYVKLDKDLKYLPENMMLSAFDFSTKDDGFYSFTLKKIGSQQKLIFDGYDFTRPQKAKNAEQIIWKKQSFTHYPELFTSNLSFQNVIKISNEGKQKDKFCWGDVMLVDWVSFNGDSLQGMLYLPANFDKTKKYPMLVYFYERYSDRLHYFHTPKPIRSVINFSYYTSNGYLIFVPDIVYKTGYPGASAYDCIISGTQAMCDRFEFINRDKMGIQGQSWGGYQVAYLVTQTNMYKAAMAGAPVSNMTSAYGGIRWGSGMSRAFQYEQTQSRIGGNLWDKFSLYIENSPLFEADRIETPLLIMHNDNDGAVPWYQGIELFSAMRRLNKPVWMLVYNGAPHNLKRRADCKDLTIRMQQFFDFYLKDAAEPAWMKYGVPALDKGKSFGFELTE